MEQSFVPSEFIRNAITDTIQSRWNTQHVPFSVEIKDGGSFGDYATNAAFVLSPLLKKSPPEIATQLAASLQETRHEIIENTKVAGQGFVNITMKPLFWEHTLSHVLSFDPAQLKSSNPKKIIVEFSSPNVARPMHMGHIRNTILGDFLARMYTFLGHEIIRWNHLGDWGTQFGKLIVAYREGWTTREAVEQNPIEELVRIYVRFHDEAKEDPSLEKRAQEEFKKLEDRDPENTALLEWFRAESLKEFNSTYNALDVTFDVERGESEYLDAMPALIENMKKLDIAQESEGALIVPLEKEGLAPALIEKSDGATLYMTRELASLEYRLSHYHPDEILYVVGNEQTLHFRQFFAIAHKLGHTSTLLSHIPYGVVLSAETKKKLSTRGGVVVTGRHMLASVIERALVTTQEKQPELSEDEQKKIASSVGISALRYSLLRDHRISDVVFDPTQALALHGNSAPYLQYAFTRLTKMLEKSGGKIGNSYSIHEDMIPTIKHIAEFPEIIRRCTEDNSSHHLAQYLFELASLCNSLYEKHSVLREEDAQKKDALIALFSSARKRFLLGFELCGIVPLQSM